jgi:MOSC domain-containing protein YiiM
MTSISIRVVGVQLGTAKRVEIDGRSVLTAIHKTAVAGVVRVAPLGLDGDEQADLSVHGGLEKAIYAYPSEHYGFWRATRRQAGAAPLDDALDFGAMGENLTLQGLLEADVWVGDILRLPNCVLRVDQPRHPCFKFNAAMGFNKAVKAMAQSGFCGFYLSVDEPGSLRVGDPVELVAGPRHIGIPGRFQASMFKHMR